MLARHLFVIGMPLSLAACALSPMKPSDGHARSEPAQSQASIPPPVQFPIALPKPKPAAKAETYSVVVNNVSASELLFALARDAKLNVDIHNGIRGSVTLNAIDQTLPQLLSRIAMQIDMRWELDGPNLIVMPDTPYLRIYKIDYVNMERTAEGRLGVSSQIGSTSGSGGSGVSGTGNASTSTVQNRSDNRFWHTLVENIKDILHETDKLIPAPGQAAAPSVPQAAAQAAPAGTSPAGTPASLPAPAQQSATFREAAAVIANAEAGLLLIRATSRQHEKLQEFLDQVMVSAKRQVLIEATIAEVQLNNQYQQGIDWSLFRRGGAGFTLNQGNTPPNSVLPSGVNTSIFTMDYVASGISATIKLLDSFGTVRVLSSPRISVVNNQTAVLKVVDNRVYFTISASTSVAANTASVTTFNTTPNVVPVGFVMNVTPQISADDTVLLNLRPSITRILDFVNDPNPNLANPCGSTPACNIAPVVSKIPEIQTREMESLIKITNGQVAVMGGLIQDSISDVIDGVPGVDQVPGLGAIFTARNQSNVKTELVIFLRPVVIRDASIDGDYRGYRTYLPGQDYLSRPNPGRPTLGGSPQ